MFCWRAHSMRAALTRYARFAAKAAASSSWTVALAAYAHLAALMLASTVRQAIARAGLPAGTAASSSAAAAASPRMRASRQSTLPRHRRSPRPRPHRWCRWPRLCVGPPSSRVRALRRRPMPCCRQRRHSPRVRASRPWPPCWALRRPPLVRPPLVRWLADVPGGGPVGSPLS